MSSNMSQQYAYRSQKTLGLIGGSPDYDSVKGFASPETASRIFTYSPDGRLFAYVLPDCVRIHYAESAELLSELPLQNIIDVSFSPRGTYVATWERYVKLEDGAQHKNLRIFSVSTGEELTSFTQKSLEGWELQYTISESHAVRLVSQEVQVFHPAEWSKGVVDKLRIDDATSISISPGLNPSIAVFVSGKSDKPANIRIYSLLSLSAGQPTCQKSTFRAEFAQFKWNTIGTQVLALIRTEVDATNKNYYGETRLYLLSTSGNFDCVVQMPKEGPIHDFTWSPNSREFGVVCGFTPTRALLLDSRAKIVHDFGSAPYNFISFNPQGRLVALAGFGNMSGKMNIFDRKTLQKVSTIDAPNTTTCEWSPDGRFLLTATLSPRLRVDNGIKIWHCSGALMHVQLVDELYQASWRPIPDDSVPAFPPTIPTAPTPNPSVGLFTATAKSAPATPVGAYRPPGARGGRTPSIYKRAGEDDGTESQSSSAPGTPGPGMHGRHVPGAAGMNGHNGHNHQNGREHRGKRFTPGAPHSQSPVRQDGEKKGRPKNNNRKDNRKRDGSGVATPAEQEEPAKSNEPGPVTSVDQDAAQAAADNAGLDVIAKKVRNLTKKLKAIEELKEKRTRGEKLEATQIKKIDGESEIRKELATLNQNAG